MNNKLSAVKTFTLKIPATRYIGKKYGNEDRENGNFGHKWREFYANDWFTVIENSSGFVESWIDNAGWYEGIKSYAGLMRWAKDVPFEYWVGVFCFPDTVVPDGFGHIDFPESVIGDCVIRALPGDIYGQDEFVRNCFKENGIKVNLDANGSLWLFERETDSSHTLDKNGMRVLEHCYFLHNEDK